MRFKVFLSFALAGLVTFLLFNWTNFIIWDANYLSALSPPKALLESEEVQLGGIYHLEPAQKIPLNIEFEGLAIMRVEADGLVRLRGEEEEHKRSRFYKMGIRWHANWLRVPKGLNYYQTVGLTNLKSKIESLENLDSTKAITTNLQVLPMRILKKTEVELNGQPNTWIDTQIETRQGDFLFITPFYPSAIYYVRVKGTDNRYQKFPNGQDKLRYRHPNWDDNTSRGGYLNISHLRLPAGRLFIQGPQTINEKITVYQNFFDY